MIFSVKCLTAHCQQIYRQISTMYDTCDVKLFNFFENLNLCNNMPFRNVKPFFIYCLSMKMDFKLLSNPKA